MAPILDSLINPPSSFAHSAINAASATPASLATNSTSGSRMQTQPQPQTQVTQFAYLNSNSNSNPMQSQQNAQANHNNVNNQQNNPSAMNNNPQQPQIFTIELIKPPASGTGFGFSMRSGQHSGKWPLTVLKISLDGLAARDGRMQVYSFYFYLNLFKNAFLKRFK